MWDKRERIFDLGHTEYMQIVVLLIIVIEFSHETTLHCIVYNHIYSLLQAAESISMYIEISSCMINVCREKSNLFII